MKKTIYLVASLALLSLGSCSLDYEPYESLPEGQVDQIEGAPDIITRGTYSLLKGWSNNAHRLTEYPGDNVALSGATTDNLINSYNYNRIITNYRANDFWVISYRAIAGTNSVLARLKEGESKVNDQLIAENLYLRAMLYFYNVNLFGRPYNQSPSTNLGVPLKLKDDPNENLPRNTVKEVYDQIVSDLLKAETLFNNDTRKGIYASKEATQALLARVYLYMEDNAKAKEYADKVISSGKFTLLSSDKLKTYGESVPENNSETIFAIKFVKDIDYDPGYSIGAMYSVVGGYGWGEMYASRPYLELIRKYPTDVRNSFISPQYDPKSTDVVAYYVSDDNMSTGVVVTKSGTDYNYVENGVTKTLSKKSNGAGDFEYTINVGGKDRKVLIDRKMADRNGYLKYYIMKWTGQEGIAQLFSPVISRLSEVYLIRAEANAKLGNTTAALADVNVIRTRASIPTEGLWTTANLNGKSALDVVLEERQLELAWEGHRKFDVFRNGRTLDRLYPGVHLSGNNAVKTVPANSNLIVEYIPQSQIILSNGVLVQNP
ncbi:RagB/SusD family nutrient uptake outer membrane protein [Empedobacter falsenii]